MQPISSPQPPCPTPPCGLLSLNKPSGMTSRQAVDVVQRLARPAKAGHAGTLDPLATGVLVVCVGGATHLIEYVQRMPKRYTATFLLGRQSPTEDVEGDGGRIASRPRAGRGTNRGGSATFCGPDRSASAGLFGLEDSRPPGVQAGTARPTGSVAAPAGGRFIASRSSRTDIRNWFWKSSAAAAPTSARWAETWPNRWARRP